MREAKRESHVRLFAARRGWAAATVVLWGILAAAPAGATHIPAPGDLGFVAEINTGSNGKFAIHNLSYEAEITGISITLGGNALFDTAPGASGNGDVDPRISPLALATAANPIGPIDPGGFGYEFTADGEDVGLLGVFGIADGAFTASFSFSDFEPGESWGFFVDYDTRDGGSVFPNGRGNTDTRVFDGAMNGASLTVSFSDGSTVIFDFPPKNNGKPVSFPALSLDRIVVPEPTALSLVGGGLLAGGLALRRRRARA